MQQALLTLPNRFPLWVLNADLYLRNYMHSSQFRLTNLPHAGGMGNILDLPGTRKMATGSVRCSWTAAQETKRCRLSWQSARIRSRPNNTPAMSRVGPASVRQSWQCSLSRSASGTSSPSLQADKVSRDQSCSASIKALTCTEAMQLVPVQAPAPSIEGVVAPQESNGYTIRELQA